MSNLKTCKLFVLAAFTSGIVAYSSYSFWRDWQSEASYRAADRSKELQERDFSDVWAACDRLEREGARIPRGKMLEGSPMQYIDLRTWHGADLRLRPLLELSKLSGIRPYDHGLYIRLGPAVGKEALPTLENLKNIAVLDPSGSPLLADEIAGIIAANPGSKVSTFQMPP